MTACVHGASVKAGIDPDSQVLVDRSLWEQVTGAPSSWLDWILDIFTFNYIKASDLCALNLDDPPLPSLTTIVTAFLHDPSSVGTLRDWVQAKLRYVAFANNCSCNPDPGETPACSKMYPDGFASWHTYVAGASYNLGLKFTPSVNVTCTGLVIYLPTPRTGGVGAAIYKDSDHSAVVSQTFDGTGGGWETWLWTTPVSLLAGTTYMLTSCVLTSQQYSQAISYTPPTGQPITYNAKLYGSGCFTYPTVDPTEWEAFYPICCTGGPTLPPSPAIPTRPPDYPAPIDWGCTTIGDLCKRLQQVSDRLDWLRRDVTVDQRRQLPFAWIAGSALTGLSGAGSITVQDCLGAIVDLTTVPASWGSSTDTPRRLYPAAGLLQGQLGSEWDDGQWVRYEHQVVLWQDPWATGLRYNFKPGVVATITPLYPEP